MQVRTLVFVMTELSHVVDHPCHAFRSSYGAPTCSAELHSSAHHTVSHICYSYVIEMQVAAGDHVQVQARPVEHYIQKCVRNAQRW